MPIDHAKLTVADLAATRAFSAAALAPFGYYAAFVLDPDGHDIEAVYRRR